MHFLHVCNNKYCIWFFLFCFFPNDHVVAKRFKNFRRFVYDYEAETFNGVNGHVNKKSGPKVSCQVCLSSQWVNSKPTICRSLMNNGYIYIKKNKNNNNKATTLFNLLQRLRSTYPRPAALSSAQRSALWARSMRWRKMATWSTAPLLELRPSETPWPGTLVCPKSPSPLRAKRKDHTLRKVAKYEKCARQEYSEDHSWGRGRCQAVPRGWRARQHPEHQEGNRLHSHGANGWGRDDQKHGEPTYPHPSDNWSVLFWGSSRQLQVKDMGLIVPKHWQKINTLHNREISSVSTAAGQSPRKVDSITCPQNKEAGGAVGNLWVKLIIRSRAIAQGQKACLLLFDGDATLIIFSPLCTEPAPPISSSTPTRTPPPMWPSTGICPDAVCSTPAGRAPARWPLSLAW